MSASESRSAPPPSSERSSLAEQLAESQERYLRIAADLENYRRRHRLEFEAAVRREREELLRGWLAIVDDLERALAAGTEAPREALLEGLVGVLREARQFLDQRGVERMDSLGRPFDPRRHEAVGLAQEGEPGQVVGELRPGYLLDGQVLRVAEVLVGPESGS